MSLCKTSYDAFVNKNIRFLFYICRKFSLLFSLFSVCRVQKPHIKSYECASKPEIQFVRNRKYIIMLMSLKYNFNKGTIFSLMQRDVLIRIEIDLGSFCSAMVLSAVRRIITSET